MGHNLGSLTLPEQLTELKEALCLLNYQFIIKGYNSGITGWNRYTGQSMGKGCRLSLPVKAFLKMRLTLKIQQTLSEAGHPL